MSNLDVIILSNIIHDIHNMIFSVLYRLLSYPMSILIKIHKLVSSYNHVLGHSSYTRDNRP